MKKIIDELLSHLENNNVLVLATILSSEGSTPRMPGTQMLILPDGKTVGTIGGGKTENEIIQRAIQVLNGGRNQICSFDLSGEAGQDMDMICGGCMNVLLENIWVGSLQQRIFTQVQASLAEGKSCTLIKNIGPPGQKNPSIENSLLYEDGRMAGVALPEGLPSLMEENSSVFPRMILHDGVQFFVQSYAPSSVLYIFGAGHVGRQLAELGARVHFEVVVLDDRPEFLDGGRFSHAIPMLLDSFENCLQELKFNKDSYIVIATRGHFWDQAVLEQALRTPAGYIGMLGSQRKKKTIYQTLLSQSFTQDDLDRVFCPIGLEIGAQTPEEIAVSIAAELIKVRAEKKR